jgi:hypothetical protein
MYGVETPPPLCSGSRTPPKGGSWKTKIKIGEIFFFKIGEISAKISPLFPTQTTQSHI